MGPGRSRGGAGRRKNSLEAGSPVLKFSPAALEEKKAHGVDVLVVAWLVRHAVYSRVVHTPIKIEETQGGRRQG